MQAAVAIEHQSVLSRRRAMIITVALATATVAVVGGLALNDSGSSSKAAQVQSTSSFQYGSADAAERWLASLPVPAAEGGAAAGTSSSGVQYGSADAAERWLTSSPSGTQYGSADAAERWLNGSQR